jgi:hypothetical protein
MAMRNVSLDGTTAVAVLSAKTISSVAKDRSADPVA